MTKRIPFRTVKTSPKTIRLAVMLAVEAGVLEENVGRLLNHRPLSITGRRNAKPSLDALRPAMELVCEEIAARTGGRQT